MTMLSYNETNLSVDLEYFRESDRIALQTSLHLGLTRHWRAWKFDKKGEPRLRCPAHFKALLLCAHGQWLVRCLGPRKETMRVSPFGGQRFLSNFIVRISLHFHHTPCLCWLWTLCESVVEIKSRVSWELRDCGCLLSWSLLDLLVNCIFAGVTKPSRQFSFLVKR